MGVKALLFICAISALLTGDVGASAAPPDCSFGCPGDGKAWRDSLVATIDEADQIELSEHSDPNDLIAQGDPGQPMKTEHVYRRLELDPGQREYFRKALQAMDVTTQHWVSACIHFYHHSFRFRRSGQTVGELNICFHCGDVSWTRSRVMPPAKIYETLRDVVTHLGFSPKRDWRDLAHAAEARENGG